MFAPLIVKPQARTGVRPSDKSTLRRATTDNHDRDIEQEQTSQRVFDNESAGATRGFSEIPIYPPGWTGESERPSPTQVPRLSGPIQRKLKMGADDDPLEREADRVADQVLRMPPKVAASPPIGGKFIHREHDESQQKKPARSHATKGAASAPDAPASVRDTLRSPGHPLDHVTREYFESRFQQNFSQVRVHTDTRASQSALHIGANAYTAGSDIVFGAGEFAPATTEGKRLLAHELTHVVQQSRGGGSGAAPAANTLRPAVVTAIRGDIIQRDSSVSTPIVEAADFVNMNFGSLFKKDYDAVASRLYINFAARGLNYHYVNVVFRNLPDDVKDNVGAEFTDILAKKSLLDICAADPLGRTMLNILYEAMITGDVSDFERKQTERILAAKVKLLSPEDFIKSTKKDSKGRPTQIFPVRNMRVTPGYDDAPLEAELVSGSKVRVKYPYRIKGTAMFKEDFRTLQGDPFSSGGVEINANEIVGIRDYETNRAQVLYRPALELIDYSNRVERGTLGKIVEVSIAAASLGAAGPAVGAAEGAEELAVEKTVAERWAARLATADRVAGYVSLVSFFVQENRYLLIHKLGAAGKLVVKLSDIADSAIAIYGKARFVQGGIQLGLELKNATRACREEAAVELSPAERAVIEKLDADTDALLKEMQDAERANAKNAPSAVAAGHSSAPGAVSKTEAAGTHATSRTHATAAPSAPAKHARPSGSQSKTGYSRTAPTSEEDIASAAGRTRRPVGAIDRGKGARPRYANDPVKPKVPGAPTHADSPIRPIPDHSAKDVFSDYPAIKHVFEGDVEGGFHSKARGSKARAKEVEVVKKPSAPGVDKTYKIKVEIPDAAGGKVRWTDAEGRVSTTKSSTMFPNHLTEREVLDEVYAVMLQKHKTALQPLPAPDAAGVVRIEGVSPRGFHIRIVLKANGEALASFYPTK
jgi:hypothetical protein